MFFSSFMVKNFKSYRQPAPVSFSPGLNLIVGQNNAGKSALLEALSLNPSANLHRSPLTVPFEGAPPPQESSIDVSFSISRDELFQMMASLPGTQFVLPYPADGSAFAASINFKDDSVDSYQRLLDHFVSHDEYTFQMTRDISPAASWRRSRSPSFGIYQTAQPQSGWHMRTFSFAHEGGKLRPLNTHSSQALDIGNQLVGQFVSQVYVFRAERFNVGEIEIGNTPYLERDARNLPAVLNLMQSHRVRFERFNQEVRRVFPQVPWISVRPTAANKEILEIVVWPFESHADRGDLAIPLKESGTGLGQVLAILYVVFASQRPSVIVIDEPQSFLHPGAARKLVEVLRKNPQHQYIIATHSPSIVSASDPKTVTIVRLTSGESILEQQNRENSKVQAILLAELGARLSDVFGCDNVLWVEGRTEEICYKTIHRHFTQTDLAGTNILGVRQTGDLEGDAGDRMLEIYNKLSSSDGLIPPALGFIFDSECRSNQKKTELTTKSRGLLHFLPRRMFENYLLHPEAIAAVVSRIENFRSTEVSIAEVTPILNKLMDVQDFYCEKKVPGTQEIKLATIHAKKVLKSVFSSLSESRVEYREVEHGLALTEWLLGNGVGELKEVNGLIKRVLDPSSAS